MKDIKEVIYGVRTFDGLVKIGHTTNLRRRMGAYGVTRSTLRRILFVMPGTREDEQCIHSWMRPYLARGAEYYHATPEVIEFVNDIRSDFGVSPLAA